MAERATCHLLNMKKKLGKFSPTFFCTYLLQLLSVSSLPSTSVLPSPVLVLVLVPVHVLALASPGFSPPHNPFTGPTLTSPAETLSTSAVAFALVLTTNSALSTPPPGSFKRGCSHIMSAKLGLFPTQPNSNPTQKQPKATIIGLHHHPTTPPPKLYFQPLELYRAILTSTN